MDIVRISAEHAEEIGFLDATVDRDGYVTLDRADYLTAVDSKPLVLSPFDQFKENNA
jgi:hypothetical protein